MSRCPLCSTRSAKRYCPAKQTSICAVCCGTKREVEIDCPASCAYLKAGRSYEAEKHVSDPQVVSRARTFDQGFVSRHAANLDLLSRAIVEERMESPWLVDSDVLEVYKALSATLKTLSSGIYYETLPEGPVRISLFRRLKTALDGLMAPAMDRQQDLLKVSDALDLLEFLTLTANANSSQRPKSRQYLDWLAGLAGMPATAAKSADLIIP
jgi:hypothetical protein